MSTTTATQDREARVKRIADMPVGATTHFLGLNWNGAHDSSVAEIGADGRVIRAIPEERLSGLKNDGRFPSQALSRFDLRNIAAVGVPFAKGPAPDNETTPAFAGLLAPTHAPNHAFPAKWHRRLESIGRPIFHFDHHEMHANTGFVLSGYREALAITSDYGAANCPHTMGVYHLVPGKITRLASVSTTDRIPLAGMYSDVTAILGWIVSRHEGKVTGLAARGRSNARCREMVWELHQEIQASPNPLYDWIDFASAGDAPPIMQTNRHLMKLYRARLADFSDEDIAHAAQTILEEKMLAVLRWVGDEFGRTLPIVCSGGVFANVKMNMLMAAEGLDVFVTPPMGDDGLSIGAGSAVRDLVLDQRRAHVASGDRIPPPPAPAYDAPAPMFLGLEPGDPRPVLEKLRAVYAEPTPGNLPRLIAAHLKDGRTVAVVRGAFEFGPRALCHRSILAAAVDPGINDRLNAQLHRTETMPFAPVLRQERVAEVFDLDGFGDVSGCLPFMTIALPVRKGIAAIAPAVVHVDGTARPQVIDKDHDPFMWDVLDEYERRTGSPLLVNTSYNGHDEPLVTFAEDAVSSFFVAGLDVLVIEDVVVELAQNQHLRQAAVQFQSRATAHLKHRVGRVADEFGRLITDGPGPFTPRLTAATADQD